MLKELIKRKLFTKFEVDCPSNQITSFNITIEFLHFHIKLLNFSKSKFFEICQVKLMSDVIQRQHCIRDPFENIESDFSIEHLHWSCR